MWSPCERIKNTSFIPVYFLKDECTHCGTLAVEVSPSTAEPYNSAPPSWVPPPPNELPGSCQYQEAWTTNSFSLDCKVFKNKSKETAKFSVSLIEDLKDQAV